MGFRRFGVSLDFASANGALLGPDIAIIMIAGLFPETQAILGHELDAAQPGPRDLRRAGEAPVRLEHFGPCEETT